MPDLFISYSPTDTAFVSQLATELSRHGLEARVEWSRDDEGAADCPPQVARSISEAGAVLFVLRQESLRSRQRQAELEVAFSQNKRVIPIVREEPGDAPVPDRLTSVKWIVADAQREIRDVARALARMIRADGRVLRAHGAASLRSRRRHWREAFKPRWNQAREPLLAACALGALVLGTIGFLQAGQHYTFYDALYRALGLFLFGGAVSYKVPLALEIARVLAPVALGWSAVRGVFHLFAEEFQVLRIRLFVRNHVVVVGLGAAGSHLVRAFYEEGWKVVAIERDEASPRVTAARDLGVPVVIADARDSFSLRRSMVRRARYLLVTSGDDGANFDIAMGARDLVCDRKRGTLTAFVHVRDLRLWRELKARAVAAVGGSAFHLEVFNLYFTAAHLMVDKFPPLEDEDGNELPDPHVCVVGLDGVGEGLVRRIASIWRERHPDRKLRLTIAGPSADVDLQSLVVRCPVLESICELEARPMDISSDQFTRGGALLDADGQCDTTIAYVALQGQGESLAAAFGLHGAPETAEVPIVVTLDDGESGTARALEGVEEGVNFARGVKPFGVLSSALTPAIALQGMTELIARQRHAEWMRERLAEGKPSDATVPWEQLREEYKEANRGFAETIGETLSEAGCIIAPAALNDATASRFAFSDAEVELLARREHERWREDMQREGWQHATEKSLIKRTHPHLVAWDELPPDVREADCEAMRDLPRFLAAAGLEIYRPRNGHAVVPQGSPAPPDPTAAPAAAPVSQA